MTASSSVKIDGYAMAPDQIRIQQDEPDEGSEQALETYPVEPEQRQIIRYSSQEPAECFSVWGPESVYHPEPELVTQSVWVIDALVLFGVISLLAIFGRNQWRYAPIHDNPLFGVKSTILDQYGLKNSFNIFHRHEWWRFATSIFLQAGVGDLVFNLFVLLLLGVPIESAFGFRPIIFIYLTSGATGMIVSSVFEPNVFSAGGSAAAAGLIGARLADIIKNGLALRGGRTKRAILTVLILGVIGGLIGSMPLIDSLAMMVSFGMGFLAGLAILKETIKIGVVIQPSPLRLTELLAGICWLLLLASAILNANEVQSGRKCFYCSVPSWFPTCLNTSYWTCAGEVIK